MESIKEKIKLELLSPAKDLLTGKTAVISGADAVYIGGPGFSARSSAGNSWNDIENLCAFAHQFYVKVYVAINTIFFDGEENEVQNSLNNAYLSGADGIIIQDMGIMMLDLPPIPVIASTQCHNYMPDHIEFLEKAGFSRVILARELSLDQIKEIRKRVQKIELEAFVYGALCVSYSGRCYFSQYLSKRSANRGRCMQVCRLPFDLCDADGRVIEKDKYLLSTKDLNLYNDLEDLLKAGVTSFKIEGRLKDQSYVGNVTACYRRELDRIISESAGKYVRASSGRLVLNYFPDLNKSFNRGFTKYFIHGRKETVVSESGQKSAGEFIGEVKKVGCDHFILDRKHDLKNGEGICWVSPAGELDGININSVEGEKIYTNRKLPYSTGIKIFRNENPNFEKAVISGAERRVGVSIEITESDGRFTVKAADEDGNSVKLNFEHDRTPAQNPNTVTEIWKKQFSKTGDTIFYLKEFVFNISEFYFVPVSGLNCWRREVLSALLKERIKNYPKNIIRHSRLIPEYPVKTIGSEFNVSNSFADDFYNNAGATKIGKAFELSDKQDIKVLMTTKYCLKNQYGFCGKYKGDKICRQPLYIFLNGQKYELEFDCLKCEMRILSPQI